MGLRTALGLRVRKSRSLFSISGPVGEAVALPTCGRTIYLRPNSPDRLVAESCFGGEFDKAIAAANPLQHGFIIDAGGYIGTAAIVFAEAFPNATVATLEPSPENFSVLQRNVEPYSNVVPMNVALGQRNGSRMLHDRKTGHWGFSLVENPVDCPSAEAIQEVDVVTIESLLDRFRVSGVDILKLDIEGCEKELLAPRPMWIKSARVIVAETHDKIVPGSQSTFLAAMASRRTSRIGEKFLSIR